MSESSQQFVVDDSGSRTGVFLEIARFEELLAAEEELECIRAYDTAQGAQDESVPFDFALKEIEKHQEWRPSTAPRTSLTDCDACNPR